MKFRVRSGLIAAGALFILYGRLLVLHGRFVVHNNYRMDVFPAAIIATGAVFVALALLPPASLVNFILRKKKQSAKRNFEL